MTPGIGGGRWVRLRDWTSAVADLGTIVPILAALIAGGAVSSRSLLAGFALAFAMTAILYRAPIPVQPLKAMAAVVLAGGVSASLVRPAAVCMAVVLGVVAMTPLERLVARIPLVLTRGMQLGVGLLLVKTAVDFLTSGGPALASRPTGVSSVGVLAALVLTQLPLTLSNAIAGTSDLAERSFPHARATTRRLAATSALANAGVAVLGGFPVCHGSSGLTAYRLGGGRSWRALAVLAVAAASLAMLPSSLALDALRAMPVPLLAAGLAVTGVRHALLVADRRGSDLALAITTGVVGVASGSLLVGMATCALTLLLRGTVRRTLGIAA